MGNKMRQKLISRQIFETHFFRDNLYETTRK